MGERRRTKGTNMRVRLPVKPLLPHLHPLEMAVARWISEGRTSDIKTLARHTGKGILPSEDALLELYGSEPADEASAIAEALHKLLAH
jgi:hypothetical protein